VTSQEFVKSSKNLNATFALADPWGAHPARAPPNGRGPMFFYAQNANFAHFFLARCARDSF